MADLKKLAEELVNLTVKDVNELANILKEEYGIEPAAAAAVVAAIIPQIVVQVPVQVLHYLTQMLKVSQQVQFQNLDAMLEEDTILMDTGISQYMTKMEML